MCDCGLVLLIIFNECYQISVYTNVICIASVVMNSGLSTCSFPPRFSRHINTVIVYYLAKYNCKMIAN